jgi:hypothetical protein
MPISKWLMYLSAILFFLHGACGIQITCFGGGASGESGLVVTQIEAAKDAPVISEISITGADINPSTIIPGRSNKFSQTHQVRDRLGKSAQVTATVTNASDDLEYMS